MSVNVIDNALASSAAGLSAQAAPNATSGSSAEAQPVVAVSGTGCFAATGEWCGASVSATCGGSNTSGPRGYPL